MTSAKLPTGPFTCEITLRRIRAPQFVRQEKQGVTYMTARDYELAYEAILHFTTGADFPIKARLIGELNQRVVIRDGQGRPVRLSGYAQGLAEIRDSSEFVIFRGRYYDSRTIRSLAGDDALTVVGQTAVDHWENGFGEGLYAGHAFSVGGQLTQEGDAPLLGECRGHID
jgi:hypothetical protein